MENKYSAMQVINGKGEFNVAGLDEFMLKTELSKCGLSYAVVAIMGSQSSGKSTLLNHLFGTNFREMDALQGRNQTTQGIWMAKCDGVQPLVAMDLEGTDGSERGEDDTVFEKQSALFALAVADIVIINMWCIEVGREQAANKPLLRTVFLAIMSLFKPRKTTLLFVLRDKTKTPFDILEKTVETDAEKIWNSVRMHSSHINTPLSEFFKVEVVALSSYEQNEELFKNEVVNLSKRLGNSISDGQPLVPASSFSISAKEIWQSIKENKNLNLPVHKIMVATIRCDEIVNLLLAQLYSDEGWMELEEAVLSEPVSDFGNKASSILETYFSEYDKETIYFDLSVRDEKRKLLVSKALDLVHPVYLNLLEKLRIEALEKFRSTLEHKMNEGGGFAASAESCTESVMFEFENTCKAAVIAHSNWSIFEIMDKLRYHIESYISFYGSIRSNNKKRCEDELERLLSKELDPLFQSPNQNTWPSIRKLLSDKIEMAYKFSGVSELEQELRDYTNSVVKRKAKEAAEKVLHLMKVRYFAGLNDATVKRQGVRKAIKKVSKESLRILSLMAAMQLDEKPNQIEEILFSTFMNKKEFSKPISVSTWPMVSPNDILITPMRCNSVWEHFQADVLPVTKEFLRTKGVMYGIKENIIAAVQLAVSIGSLLFSLLQ